MNPVCSATPTPSNATSTNPSGGNSTNVFTIRARKVVSAAGTSMFFTRIGSDEITCPSASRFTVRGSASVNSTDANSADTTHTMSSAITKIIAGSGSLFPIASNRSRRRRDEVFGILAGS